jgi:filamentous hemagglutinin
MFALCNNFQLNCTEQGSLLVAGMTQKIVIDIRGQVVTVKQKYLLINGIVKKSNGIIIPESIEFKEQ